MASSTLLWSLPLVFSAVTLNSNVDPIRLGIAYFEPPRSIGTPFEDVVRAYTGTGLAAKIEGRLRLDTDASLTEGMRELIRQRLAQDS